MLLSQIPLLWPPGLFSSTLIEMDNGVVWFLLHPHTLRQSVLVWYLKGESGCVLELCPEYDEEGVIELHNFVLRVQGLKARL